MTMKKRMILLLIAVLSFSAWAGIGRGAEKYPSKEIIIIVNLAAGGSMDLITRVLAQYLGKELGVPVVVENRIEAAGAKGIMDVYKAKPDGYTLLTTLYPRQAQAEIVYKAPYKILELTHLVAFQKQELLVAVRKDSPYKTLEDLIEASKKKSLNCSISGLGAHSHLVAMVLKRKAGINLEVVPFKGAGPAMTALIGGHVDFGTMDDMTFFIQQEKLRALAMFTDKRSEKFRGVPTISERGFDIPAVAGYSIMGISGPPNLPEGIRQILAESLAKSIKNPEFVSKVDQLGTTPVQMSGQEFRAVAGSFYKLVEEYKDIFVERK